MSRSTITTKGQTTIPAAIRAFLDIHAGDMLEFIPQEDGSVKMMPTIDISELAGILPKPKKPLSLKAMQKAIEEHAVRKHL